ncbi:MAG: RluA family pseudouridine synthase [Deltaproteobacteria bacterium]|nr:RluA family pseudouridine synthase [Deltaproteobacteria bacterium]
MPGSRKAAGGRVWPVNAMKNPNDMGAGTGGKATLTLPEAVYEDRQLMVITKPNGWLSQADGCGDRPDALEWARRRVADNRPQGGRPFVGLCHRLDRQVGGLMVIAKTSKAAARISAQFRERAITKVYAAICLGRPDPPEADLSQDLLRDGCVTRLPRGQESGTPCRLRYRVLGTGTVDGARVARLEVELITGFKHQIRAQLSSIGHPIYGDGHYGAPGTAPGGEAIGLCSTHLSFVHPISRERMSFDCPLDKFWPFARFVAD